MMVKQFAISAVLATGLAAAPFSRAEAHRHFCGPLCWPFAAAAAVVGTAAVVATAPIRAVAGAPYYGYYAPGPAYYPPAPAYYAPPAYYGTPAYYGYPYYR
jgi:hypothetical protein